MSESDAEVTITIPAKQAAAQHIEHLQSVLTSRNKQIEALTERLAQAEAGEPNQTALADAYKRGWRAACDELTDSTQKAARALSKIRSDAFDIYIKGHGGDI
ncbi:hypothetical protein [Curtobacterium sp. MCBA15_004]|uniref:hypothetical protein n=1 Tax=Curtobacterium sp. MCBA15_004 TaxID=1898733 RepID=UPI000911C271|nr:hypothetical protein [Curtobacterium sp. MCBA15_004]WIA95832.1 hypothetical protein QOL16_12005 [Curtobacterium sp. MCBA15_004]